MQRLLLVLILGLAMAGNAIAAPAKAAPRSYQAELGRMETPWGVLQVYDRLTPSKTVAPQIPSNARKPGLACALIAISLVGPNGQVTETKIQRSCGTNSLDQAALLALKQWRYRVPVAGEQCVSVQPVTFSIE